MTVNRFAYPPVSRGEFWFEFRVACWCGVFYIVLAAYLLGLVLLIRAAV